MSPNHVQLFVKEKKKKRIVDIGDPREEKG